MSATSERNYVVFTTGLFRDEQPDDELDQWFLGEDCARWLEAKLLGFDGISPGVSPLEEDWHGWTFGIRVHGTFFWIKIWSWARKTWVVGVEPKPGPLPTFRRSRTKRAKAKLCEELDSIVAVAPEIESHEWLEHHPGDLPRLVITDPSKLHVASAPTYEPRSWQWRLYIPDQAKLGLFIASDEILAHGFPEKYRASDLPSGEIPIRAEVRQGRLGQWKVRAVYPSGLLGLEVPEGRSAWFIEPDGYSESQAGVEGTELANPSERVVLLQLCAKQHLDGNEGRTTDPRDGVMIWVAENRRQ